MRGRVRIAWRRSPVAAAAGHRGGRACGHEETIAEATMTDTLDAALEALRREQFYRDMADAETRLRARPDEWADFVADRNRWLDTDLG